MIGALTVELLYGAAIAVGFEKAIEEAGKLMGGPPRYLSEIEKAQLLSATIALPSGYERYGILFEVHGLRDSSGNVEYIALPRSYGKTPSHAIVNERATNENFPEIASGYSQSLRERRLEIERAAQEGQKTRKSGGIWLEYSPVTQKWSTEPVSMAQVVAVGEAQVTSLKSLKVLAEDAADLEKFRARAVAWRALAEQFQAQIDKAGLSVVIADLIKANSDMTRALEEAAADARRAKSFSDFHGALALASSLMGVAQAVQASSIASKANYDIQREKSVTLLTQHGDKLMKTELDLRSRFTQIGVQKNFIVEGTITDEIIQLKP